MVADLGSAVRRGQLASALQETLTVTTRLRANRQVVVDADSFRVHAKQLLAAAQQIARQAGYAEQDVNLALYAATAFLDESVLNSSLPAFADWARRPLQDEIFGGHVGGEVFFQNLEALLARLDSEDKADLLEVYELCLLLGFRGRYGSRGIGAEVEALAARAGEAIARVRGPVGELAPWWPPRAAVAARRRDPWLPRLTVIATTAVALAVVLYVAFSAALGTGIADTRALAGAPVVTAGSAPDQGGRTP